MTDKSALDALDEAFNKFWAGVGEQMNQGDGIPDYRSTFKAGYRAALTDAPSGDDLREAVYRLENVTCSEEYLWCDIETLIRAAQTSQETKETNAFLDRKLGEAYRELEAQPKPDAVEVVTIRKLYNDFNDDGGQELCEYITKRYPNGVKIVSGE